MALIHLLWWNTPAGGDFMRCWVDFVICELWGDFSFQGCDFCMLKPTKFWIDSKKQHFLLWNQSIWCTFDSMVHHKGHKTYSWVAVACKGLVMPGATAWLEALLPNSSIEQWRMVVIVTGYTLWVTLLYDVIFTLATNVLTKFVHTTCIFRDAVAAVGQGGAKKQLRSMETYKNKKIVTKYVCFCSSTMLTSKIITEIIEKHSKFSGCPNSCNSFVLSRSW